MDNWGVTACTPNIPDVSTGTPAVTDNVAAQQTGAVSVEAPTGANNGTIMQTLASWAEHCSTIEDLTRM